MAQTQAMQLAEQINDEFLTCKICFEHYKDPKCLSCVSFLCYKNLHKVNL